MKKVDKRGLSPVIATVLLIMIALILAVIIFLWARSFVGEAVSKEKYSRIEQACVDIKFRAEAFASGSSPLQTIDIVNDGDVPIYGIQVGKKGFGSISVDKFPGTIANGQTQKVDVSSKGFVALDELQITPVIVGTAGETKRTYVCADSFVDVTVQSS